MNHNYHPMNPSPFTQHQHPPAGYAPTGSVNGPGMPSHSSQYYGMHPSYPPAPHGYAPYYPQQMMMYPPPPRANATVPEQPQPSNAISPVQQASTSAAIGKRKRKPESGRGKTVGDKDSDQEGPSGSDVPPAKPSTPAAAASAVASDSRKRTKTQRACDSCRSRKIRCGLVFVVSFLLNLFSLPF